MHNVLVTGGGGFIGKHLVKKLLQNKFSVDSLDIEGVNCNFIKDITNVDWETINLESYDSVVHLAAKVSVPESFEIPDVYFQVNVSATEKLFEKCVEKNVKNVIFASSAAVYGNSLEEVKIVGEEGVIESPYAKNKTVGENLAYLYSKSRTKFTCLRFFNVYGPGQKSDSPYASVIPIFIDKIIKGQDLEIFGNGKQTRDFIHVSDLCDVIISCICNDSLPNFNCINLGTGKGVSILDLANNLLDYSFKYNYSTDSKIKFQPSRLGDVLYSTADILPLKGIYDTNRFIPFEEGLEELFKYSISGVLDE